MNNVGQEIARLAKDFDKPQTQKSLDGYSKEQYGDFFKIISKPSNKNNLLTLQHWDVSLLSLFVTLDS